MLPGKLERSESIGKWESIVAGAERDLLDAVIGRTKLNANLPLLLD